jgi:hypothetical protein
VLQGKLERQQLAKDLAEGRAPAMKLPAPAGRGRGMTMPAWMRKKMSVYCATGSAVFASALLTAIGADPVKKMLLHSQRASVM